MFGIGGTELVIIAVVLLIAVGPDRLPNLLKGAVKGYREFRRATRELRASTGIDEILQDEDLRDLRKPLYVPPPKGQTVPAKSAARKRSLSYAERVREVPSEGVDLAEIREAERKPTPEEAERIRAAKEAELADAEAIRAQKLAAAGQDAYGADEYDDEYDDEHEFDYEYEYDPDLDEEERRIVEAKIAAAQRDRSDLDDEEERRIVEAKIAAARGGGEDAPAARAESRAAEAPERSRGKG